MRGRVRGAVVLVVVAAAVVVGLAVWGGPSSPGRADDLFGAVQRTATASSYGFEGEVRLVTAAGATTLVLDGAVDGTTRQLRVVTPAGAEVVYRVEDGVATIDRGDGPGPAPSGEVVDDTGLALLAEIQRVVNVGPGRYQGELAGDVLVETLLPAGGEVAGAGAIVSVEVDTRTGVLRNYVVTAREGTWRISVTFADVVLGPAE